MAERPKRHFVVVASVLALITSFCLFCARGATTDGDPSTDAGDQAAISDAGDAALTKSLGSGRMGMPPPLGVAYASALGSGTSCTQSSPCSITTAHSFINGGTVLLEGNAATPFRLSSTLTFTSANSGETWSAAPCASPVVEGSIQVTGWTPGADAGANTIWSASVPPGTVTRQFYVNGHREYRARYPNPTVNANLAGYTHTSTGFTLNGSDPNPITTWPDNLGIEWVGTGDCMMYRCRASAISDAGITIEPECWASANNVWRPFDQVTMYENAIELVDAPGEWFLDTVANVVYYIPNIGENMATADVEIPIVQTLMAWQGTPSAPIVSPTISGITFAYSGWTAPTTATAGFVSWCGPWYAPGGVANPLGWNTNLNGYANIKYSTLVDVPGALDFQGIHGGTFTGNMIEHMGSVGLFFHNSTQNTTINSNWIYDTSEGCIVDGDALSEAEYQPAAVDASASAPMNNSVSNNVCETYGQEYFAAFGVFIASQANAVVQHNSIFNGSYVGLCLYGHAGADDPDGGNGFTNPSNKQGSYVANNDVQYTCGSNKGNNGGFGVDDCGSLLTNGWDRDASIVSNTIGNQVVPSGTLFIDQGASYLNTASNNCVFKGQAPNGGGQLTWWLALATGPPGIHDSNVGTNYTDFVPGTGAGGVTLEGGTNTFTNPTYVALIDDDGGTVDGAIGPCGALLTTNGSTLRGPNMLYGKTVSGPFGSGKLGNDGYGWSAVYSPSSANSYWQGDMGASCNVIEVDYIPDLQQGADLTARSNLRIDISNDSAFGTYTTVATIDANGIPTFNLPVYLLWPGVNARYGRVTKTVGGQNFGLGELQMYCH